MKNNIMKRFLKYLKLWWKKHIADNVPKDLEDIF